MPWLPQFVIQTCTKLPFLHGEEVFSLVPIILPFLVLLACCVIISYENCVVTLIGEPLCSVDGDVLVIWLIPLL